MALASRCLHFSLLLSLCTYLSANGEIREADMFLPTNKAWTRSEIEAKCAPEKFCHAETKYHISIGTFDFPTTPVGSRFRIPCAFSKGLHGYRDCVYNTSHIAEWKDINVTNCAPPAFYSTVEELIGSESNMSSEAFLDERSDEWILSAFYNISSLLEEDDLVFTEKGTEIMAAFEIASKTLTLQWEPESHNQLLEKLIDFAQEMGRQDVLQRGNLRGELVARFMRAFTNKCEWFAENEIAVHYVSLNEGGMISEAIEKDFITLATFTDGLKLVKEEEEKTWVCLAFLFMEFDSSLRMESNQYQNYLMGYEEPIPTPSGLIPPVGLIGSDEAPPSMFHDHSDHVHGQHLWMPKSFTTDDHMTLPSTNTPEQNNSSLLWEITDFKMLPLVAYASAVQGNDHYIKHSLHYNSHLQEFLSLQGKKWFCGYASLHEDAKSDGLDTWYSYNQGSCRTEYGPKKTSCICEMQSFVGLFEEDHTEEISVAIDLLPIQQEGNKFPYTKQLHRAGHVMRATSMACLALTMGRLLYEKISFKRHSLKPLMHHSVAFLCLLGWHYVTDVIHESTGGCIAAQAIQFYFILVALLTNGMEGYNLASNIMTRLRAKQKYFVYSGIITCWGLPTVVIGAIFLINNQSFDPVQESDCEYSCRLQHHTLYNAYLAPIAVIFLHNLAVFIFVAKQLVTGSDIQSEDCKQAENHTIARKRLPQAAIILILFGSSWMCAPLGAASQAAGNELTVVEAIYEVVFIAGVGLHGAVILVFTTLTCASKSSRQNTTNEKARPALPDPLTTSTNP